MLHPDRPSLEMRESPPFRNEGLPMCQLGGDIPSSSRKALKLQFLGDRYGVSKSVASLLAPPVWEKRNG